MTNQSTWTKSKCAKTALWIKVRFMVQTLGHIVLDGGPDPPTPKGGKCGKMLPIACGLRQSTWTLVIISDETYRSASEWHEHARDKNSNSQASFSLNNLANSSDCVANDTSGLFTACSVIIDNRLLLRYIIADSELARGSSANAV